MSNNSLLIVLNAFPNIKVYLNKYINSINTQTYKNYDVLIVNQGLNIESFNKLKNIKKIINIDKNKKVAEVRQVGWNFFYINNYKYLICSDGDDYFSKNRLEKSFNFLKRNYFTYNNIIQVNNNRIKVNTDRINIPKKTKNLSDILLFNYVGGSSSGYKKTNQPIIKIPINIIATDWWIASIYLINGYKGNLIKNSFTYYRQHNNNVIGVKKKVSLRSVDFIMKVKLVHYKELLNYCKLNRKIIWEKKIEKIFLEYIQLSKLLNDQKFKKKYIEVINKNYKKIYSLWWSELITVKEFRNYNE